MDTGFERGDVNDASPEPPLCVDLDGTIIAGDSLKISLLQLGLARPWRLAPLAFGALRGRAWFKKRVADAILPDPARLPYQPAVLGRLREERQRGRRLIMVTAADQRVARFVANHLGIFDAVLGSDGRINLKGPHKLRAIQQFLGGQEFDYMADDMADLVTLRAARRAFLVNPSRQLLRAARESCRVEGIFE